MVLYRELYRFTWNGLWQVRFSLCLVTGGTSSVNTPGCDGCLQDSCPSSVLSSSQICRTRMRCMLYSWSQSFVTSSWLSMPSPNSLLPTTSRPSIQTTIRQSSVPLGSVTECPFQAIPDVPETTLICDADVIPEKRVNVLSRMTFSWISPLLRQGYRQPLEFDDVWLLDKHDRAQTLSSTFQKHWKKECQLGQGRGQRKWEKPSLFRALRRSVGHLFLQVPHYSLLSHHLDVLRPFH